MKKFTSLFLVLFAVFSFIYTIGVYAANNASTNTSQSPERESTIISGHEHEESKSSSEAEEPNHEKNNDIKKELPPVRFLLPKQNQTIRKKFPIQLKVDNAQSVEFYIRHPGSLSSIYLGSAEKQGENHWKYFWQTDNSPNGQYNLYAKVKNQYGNYESNSVKIEINNPVTTNKETKEKMETIKKQEQETEAEAEAEKSQHKENFQEEIQKTASEDEKAEEIRQKIEEQKEAHQKKIEEAKKRAEEARQKNEKIEQSIEKEVSPEIEALDETIEEIAKTKNGDLSKSEKKEKAEEIRQKVEEQKEAHQKKIEEAKKRAEEARQKNEEQKTKKIEQLNRQKEEIKNRIVEKTQNILEKEDKSKTKTEQEKQVVKEEIKKKIEQLEKTLTITEQKRQKKIEQLKKKDTDRDKIPDLEEIRLGTNLSKADSDEDGYLDYDEIKNGYDPLVSSPEDKMVYQDPKTTTDKATITKDYKVTSVKTAKTENKKQGILLSGKALPHSFVTIYIYSSQPTVVVAKTDANGNWSYTLDKPLEDGEHEVYVATTNNKGEISSKSKPVYFIKKANAISSISSHSVFDKNIAKAATTEKAANNQKNISVFNYIFLAISIIIFIIGIALIIIGLRTSRKYKIQ